MKNITYFLFAYLLFINISTAQSYKISYDVAGETKAGIYELYFDNDQAIYKNDPSAKEKRKQEKNNATIKEAMDNVEANKPKKINEEVVLRRERQPLGTVRYVESASDYRYSVVDDQAIQIWTKLADTKTIGNYSCRKAMTNFRGRFYEVWYTKEIPFPYGPWKLAGLEGLILEARSTDGNYTFRFESIEKIEPEVLKDMKYDFQPPILDYMIYVGKLDDALQQEANNIQKEVAKGFMAKFMNAKMSAMKMNVKHIEKNLAKVYTSTNEK